MIKHPIIILIIIDIVPTIVVIISLECKILEFDKFLVLSHHTIHLADFESICVHFETHISQICVHETTKEQYLII